MVFLKKLKFYELIRLLTTYLSLVLIIIILLKTNIFILYTAYLKFYNFYYNFIYSILIYFFIKAIRFTYDNKTNRLSWLKIPRVNEGYWVSHIYHNHWEYIKNIGVIPVLFILIFIHFTLALPILFIRLFFIFYWLRWLYLYVTIDEIQDYHSYHMCYSSRDKDYEYSSYYNWYYWEFGFLKNRLWGTSFKDEYLQSYADPIFSFFIRNYICNRYIRYTGIRTFYFITNIIKIYIRFSNEKIVNKSKAKNFYIIFINLIIFILELMQIILLGLPHRLVLEYFTSAKIFYRTLIGDPFYTDCTALHPRIRDGISEAGTYFINITHTDSMSGWFYKDKLSKWNEGKPKTLEQTFNDIYIKPYQGEVVELRLSQERWEREFRETCIRLRHNYSPFYKSMDNISKNNKEECLLLIKKLQELKPIKINLKKQLLELEEK